MVRRAWRVSGGAGGTARPSRYAPTPPSYRRFRESASAGTGPAITVASGAAPVRATEARLSRKEKDSGSKVAGSDSLAVPAGCQTTWKWVSGAACSARAAAAASSRSRRAVLSTSEAGVVKIRRAQGVAFASRIARVAAMSAETSAGVSSLEPSGPAEPVGERSTSQAT